MTMTMEQIVDVYTVFSNLSNMNVSFKVSYWITKNTNLLSDDYMFYISKRGELYQTYLDDIDGSYLKMIDDTHAQFNIKEDVDGDEFMNKFNELLNMECDITPYTIGIQTLMDSTLEISSQQLRTIESFITEEE